MSKIQTTSPLRTAALAAALGAAALLAACGDDSRTVGQQVDQTLEQAGQKAGQAADTTVAVVTDAAITAAVNARLAGDEKLSVLKIDVDTVDGRVSLSGQAPDESARQRATELAAAVDGVRTVNNMLVVAKG